MALDEVRKVLGSRNDLTLVDEQWVGILRRMIDVLTRLRKVIDFHQTRISFERVLQHYRRYRQELEDEIKTLQILECLKSTEATHSLLDRLGKIPELMMAAASTFNDIAKWSITEKPKSVGPTWFRLGSLPREPFHLFVSLDEG